jgi:glycosyltransferase involved in cell wall biosynthesis
MADQPEKSGPRVSVVMPAYNASRCITRAIDSVLAQSRYIGIEIIVVDDGSTDNTAQVVKNYDPKVRYIYQLNAGVSAARNTGIAAAKGQWIAFLDADDEWLPEKLQRQMELISRNPDLRWCGANYYRDSGTRREPMYSVKAISGALAGRDYVENYFRLAGKMRFGIETQTAVVRRDVFDELGGFEPGRDIGEDLDMWWRIAYRYPKAGYIAEPLAVMYLDIHHPVLTERRVRTKKGAEIRTLVARHLKLATEQGKLDDFKLYAKKEMRRRLLMMIYNGFSDDARQTVKQFPELLPWYWRVGTYIATLCPRLTFAVVHSLAYIAYICRLDREVSRRWIKPPGPGPAK